MAPATAYEGVHRRPDGFHHYPLSASNTRISCLFLPREGQAALPCAFSCRALPGRFCEAVLGYSVHGKRRRLSRSRRQEPARNEVEGAGGYWLWDIAYSTTDYILRTGGDRKTFYCPFDTTKRPDMAILWQFSQSPPYGATPDHVAEPTTGRDNLYRVTSYFWLMDTKNGRTDRPLGVPDHWKWPKTLNVRNAAGTELVLDATLSTGPDPNTASFTEVRGGLFSQYGLFDRTNHIRSGGKPDGANIIFVDGHLEPRHFNEMIVRRNGPTHWW